jgi:hypothetical protein
MDYVEFAETVVTEAHKYKAKIGFERNGVGLGLGGIIRLKEYKYLYYDAPEKEGLHKSSSDTMINALVDALLDYLVIHDRKNLSHLQNYRADKLVQITQKASILNPGEPGKGRRDRHHWDDVSALEVAVMVARSMPRRTRAQPYLPPKPSAEMSYTEWSKYANEEAKRRSKRMRRKL